MKHVRLVVKHAVRLIIALHVMILTIILKNKCAINAWLTVKNAQIILNVMNATNILLLILIFWLVLNVKKEHIMIMKQSNI